MQLKAAIASLALAATVLATGTQVHSQAARELWDINSFWDWRKQTPKPFYDSDASVETIAGWAGFLLARAIDEVKRNNAEKLLAAISDGSGAWDDNELYVYCFNIADGKIAAHPNPKLLRRDVRSLKDFTGMAVGQKIFEAAQEEGDKTVDYVFPKAPFNGRAVPKQALVRKARDYGCVVSYYK